MIFQLFVTQQCNLNCKYCFEGEKKSSRMNKDIVPFLVSFMKNYINNDFVEDKEIWVNFNGGEALLEKDFIKYAVNFFKKNGITHFSISTNFTLIDDDILTFLIENNFIMQISVDGMKHIHDLNRIDYDGNGTFDKVWYNLKKIDVINQNLNIHYSMVFTPETISNLYESVDFLFRNGKRYVIASFNSKAHWTEREIEILQQQAILCRKLYVKMFEKEIPVYFKLISQYIQDFFNGFNRSKCGICRDLIGITPNGGILACGAFLGNESENEFLIGSIYKTEINTTLVQKLLYQKNTDKVCLICSLKDRCHNDCLVCNFDCNGDLGHPDEMTCHIPYY